MTTSTDILLAAADLLDRPGAWSPQALARNADGVCTSPYEEDAVSWCATGALMRVSQEADIQDYRAARAQLAETLYESDHEPDIVDWNDAHGRTQAEVVAMLRRAAEED